MQCERARELLSAYRDGELAPDERRAVAAHVETCKACADVLGDDERIARAVRGQGRTPAPPALAPRIRAALERVEGEVARQGPRPASTAERRRILPLSSQFATRFAKRAAALTGACVLSALSTWWALTTAGQTDRIERELVTAHIRSLIQDVPIQVASSDQHTVRPWFAGRIDIAPDVKDLTAKGFPLLGGRLDYIADRRVGVVVYKRHLHIVNVFMWQAGATAENAPSAAKRNGYNMLSWNRNGVTYWAVSDLNTDELRELQRLM